MMHSTLPDGARILLHDLESIKHVMEERHEAGLKAKAKEASASAIAMGTSKKHSASGSPGEQVLKKGKPNKVLPALQGKGQAPFDSQHQGVLQVWGDGQSHVRGHL